MPRERIHPETLDTILPMQRRLANLCDLAYQLDHEQDEAERVRIRGQILDACAYVRESIDLYREFIEGPKPTEPTSRFVQALKEIDK